MDSESRRLPYYVPGLDKPDRIDRIDVPSRPITWYASCARERKDREMEATAEVEVKLFHLRTTYLGM